MERVRIKITYVEANGTARVVDAAVGGTVMEAAVKAGVEGIAADCGGACACATCRVYVPAAWRERTGEPSEMEQSMLDYAGDTTEGVRLSCQLRVTPELDGLEMKMPESQH